MIFECLTAYSGVPEAYRQRFRMVKRKDRESYLNLSRKIGVACERWLKSTETYDFAQLKERVLLEQFKNSVPRAVEIYLSEQKISTLLEAAQRRMLMRSSIVGLWVQHALAADALTMAGVKRLLVRPSFREERLLVVSGLGWRSRTPILCVITVGSLAILSPIVRGLKGTTASFAMVVDGSVMCSHSVPNVPSSRAGLRLWLWWPL